MYKNTVIVVLSGLLLAAAGFMYFNYASLMAENSQEDEAASVRELTQAKADLAQIEEKYKALKQKTRLVEIELREDRETPPASADTKVKAQIIADQPPEQKPSTPAAAPLPKASTTVTHKPSVAATGGAIQVLYPNGLETLCIGKENKIGWLVSDPRIETVNVAAVNNGLTINLGDYPAYKGNIVWNGAMIDGRTAVGEGEIYKIQVRGDGQYQSASDKSDDYITIK